MYFETTLQFYVFFMSPKLIPYLFQIVTELSIHFSEL